MYADEETTAEALTRWQESLGRPHWPQSKPRTTQTCRKLCQAGAKPHSYVFGRKKVDTLGCGIWEALVTLVEDGVNAGRAMPEAAAADNSNEGDMENIFQDTRQNRHKRDIGRFGILRCPLLCFWGFVVLVTISDFLLVCMLLICWKSWILRRWIKSVDHYKPSHLWWRSSWLSMFQLHPSVEETKEDWRLVIWVDYTNSNRGLALDIISCLPGGPTTAPLPGLLCKVKSRIH